jgi:hypothetical protein
MHQYIGKTSRRSLSMAANCMGTLLIMTYFPIQAKDLVKLLLVADPAKREVAKSVLTLF